jgi:hypothetical protein
MRHTARLTLAVTLILGATVMLPACSKADVSKLVGLKATAAAAGADNMPVDPETGTMVVESAANGVVINNRVGRRLINVRISIDINESQMPFVLVVPTIDKETKTLFEFARFRSEEATLLDPNLMHLKQVSVTARDTFTKAHETVVPWTTAP